MCTLPNRPAIEFAVRELTSSAYLVRSFKRSASLVGHVLCCLRVCDMGSLPNAELKPTTSLLAVAGCTPRDCIHPTNHCPLASHAKTCIDSPPPPLRPPPPPSSRLRVARKPSWADFFFQHSHTRPVAFGTRTAPTRRLKRSKTSTTKDCRSSCLPTGEASRVASATCSTRCAGVGPVPRFL